MSDNILPSLRETIDAYDLNARKTLGQHFLLDMNITRKIARLADVNPGDTVIEVGPGPGGLTRALLEMGADVIAIERDDRCLDILDTLKRHAEATSTGTLTVLAEDALKVNFQTITEQKPVKFISNLPYNISTELLVRWLTLPAQCWQQMTLMFQREVAERILAVPGNKTYGRLSVLSQSASLPARGLNLPARAFTPPPKVESTVVTFDPARKVDFPLPMLELISRHAFAQRRKMVRTSLKPVFGAEVESQLAEIGLAATLRAEDIDIASYQHLARLAAKFTAANISH